MNQYWGICEPELQAPHSHMPHRNLVQSLPVLGPARSHGWRRRRRDRRCLRLLACSCLSSPEQLREDLLLPDLREPLLDQPEEDAAWSAPARAIREQHSTIGLDLQCLVQ